MPAPVILAVLAICVTVLMLVAIRVILIEDVAFMEAFHVVLPTLLGSDDARIIVRELIVDLEQVSTVGREGSSDGIPGSTRTHITKRLPDRALIVEASPRCGPPKRDQPNDRDTRKNPSDMPLQFDTPACHGLLRVRASRHPGQLVGAVAVRGLNCESGTTRVSVSTIEKILLNVAMVGPMILSMSQVNTLPFPSHWLRQFLLVWIV